MSEVKTTRDYDVFKVMEGNREVDVPHVRRLMRVIKENDLTAKFPIVVNSNMEVVDGQHRLEALKRLDLPVNYRVEDDVAIEDVRVINQVNKRWSWNDLARSYVELGNENYQPLLDLNEQRPGLFNLDTLLAIANVTKTRNNTKPLANYFFGGGLVLDDEQRAELLRKTAYLSDFADLQPHFKRYSSRNSYELPRAYSSALIRIMKSDKYDHQTFMQRLSSAHVELPAVVDVNEALRELEKAYNHKLSEENRVRLF